MANKDGIKISNSYQVKLSILFPEISSRAVLCANISPHNERLTYILTDIKRSTWLFNYTIVGWASTPETVCIYQGYGPDPPAIGYNLPYR